ncbi:hypothetical protein Pcinc_033486 [Petrolisthes cinctipes]|uniref:C2H2-type domain-containing protein n=1 Tax=Petrolisthes cinctipes TaxID=88211 RepID=A0AAE1ES15_PETCI|nr:hypothetical protein Pcinc_033486 [Petrolisthes cinctipes]
MGELQQLFTHLVNNIQSFLSQAQAASLVEKYVLEVNLSANEPTSILSNPNQHALLCSALTALLHTLLKVVEYCRSIRKKTYQHSRTEISESQTMDDLSVSQVSSTEKQQQQQHQHNIIARNNQGVNNIQTEEEQRKSDKLSPRVSHNPSEVTSVGHHTPPQHPTTKEAEAANVLMNLSGKASTSDRLGQAGLDSGVTCLSPPAHILQLSSRDLSSSKDHNRFVEYSCPESLLVTNNSISSNNVYSSTSLTYLTSDITTLKPAVYCWADEVPQINEEDLLPLATEVVCNVCEQQCKDVVELHEHLLAAHNTPDNPHDTLHQSKKFKNHPDDNSEYVDTSRVILQESGGNKVLTKERKCKRKSRSKRIDDMNCNVSDKVSISSSENCVRSSEVLDRNQNHTLTTSLQTVDDPSAKEPSTYILPSSTPSTCLVTTKSVVDNGYVFSTPQKGTTNTGETHICMSPYSSQNNPPVIESSVEGHQQAFSPAARVTPSTDSLHTFILPHSSSGNPTVVVKSDSFGAKNQDLLRYHSHNTATEVVTAASDLLPTTGEKLAAGTDALAIAIEKSQIETKEVKVMIFVCVDCSCGFTENEEASKHTCLPGQPLIKRHPDCSVTLSDNHPMSQIPQERIDQELYFPEFVIRQIKGQTGVKDQFIVHTETSCTLQLYTPYQPDYMRHQLVSFRCLLCKSECDNMGVFLRHLQHGPCIFRCPDCPISYNTHTKLFTHRSNLHPNLEERTCPNCHQVFEKRHQRNKHLKTKCSQRLTCSVCSRTLKNEYILSVHMLSHKERSHECSECGATFHRRTVLQQHQMRHTGTKPHACPRCDSRFYTRQHLHIHLDRHDRHKRFPCDACSRAYYSKHDLEAHRSKTIKKLLLPLPGIRTLLLVNQETLRFTIRLQSDEIGVWNEADDQ